MPKAAPSSRRANQSGTMKAAAIERFGPPAVLKLHELPVPQPAPNEVLIALQASGVGVWDADIRKGWWPRGRPQFPLVLGTDGAGLLAAKGARVRRFEVGERVWAYEFINAKGGFYAEYVAVRAENVGRVPERLDLLHAGAATVTALTALQGVDDVLGLRRGQTALIFGATGAVGTLALQFAKRLGARVIATATGRKATRLVLGLGAAVSFDARADDATERLRALAPEGLDAVLAFAGGPTLDRCLDLVKAEGRVAYPNGVEPEPKRRRRQFSVRSYDAEASPRLFSRLERAVDEARLQVPVAAVYPLAQAARAHERLERGGVLGRIVLRIARRPRERV
ncbi:MAG: Bifunctional protein: zinc-containing alcohol dehydrogenase [Gammaproteobacteria bacterium]|jgi:NADPH2:quinone reductase|nr:Bifunctional protein: zinc-containing alcohol dehydrogenase [Gammaproteobacteria bacterium]